MLLLRCDVYKIRRGKKKGVSDESFRFNNLARIYYLLELIRKLLMLFLLVTSNFVHVTGLASMTLKNLTNASAPNAMNTSWLPVIHVNPTTVLSTDMVCWLMCYRYIHETYNCVIFQQKLRLINVSN